MAQNETWLKHDLLDAVKVQYLDGNLFSMDNAGNLIGVTLTRDGEDYSGGGSVSANVIRSDGGTVAVTGALSGKTATVVLPQAAYAVPGVVSIVVKLTASGQVTTIAALVANVYRSSTDTAVDPGTIIPSIQTLISQINTAVASIPADYSALWTKLAPAFSTDTSYVAGQYVTYNSGLYRFNTSHSGSWSSSDVTAVNLGGEISDLKSALKQDGEINSYGKYTCEFVQGARVASTNPFNITSRNDRVTTKTYFMAKPGDRISVSGSYSGIKYVIVGADAANYDSGWKTEDFSITVGVAGVYYVNAAKSNGTSNISPSDVTFVVKFISDSEKLVQHEIESIFAPTVNFYNEKTVLHGVDINTSTGVLVPNSTYKTSQPIILNVTKRIKVINSTYKYAYCYDSSGVFLGRYDTSNSSNSPSQVYATVSFIRIIAKETDTNVMVVYYTTDTSSYIPFLPVSGWIDKTFAKEGYGADAKETGERITNLQKNKIDVSASGGNLFDYSNRINNTDLNSSTGEEVSSNTYYSSDFIPIDGTRKLFIKGLSWSSSGYQYGYFYASDKSFIGRYNCNSGIIPNTESGATVAFVRIIGIMGTDTNVMVIYDYAPSSFVPFNAAYDYIDEFFKDNIVPLELRVASYNAGAYKGTGYTKRSPELAEQMRIAIGNSEAHIVCGQEDLNFYNLDNNVTLRDAVYPNFKYYSRIFPRDYDGYTFASDYLLYDAKTINYSIETEVNYTHKCFYSAYCLIHGILVRLITMHVEWKDNAVRTAQLQQIKAHADNYDRVIIVGDFNPEDYIDGVRQSANLTYATDLQIFTSHGYTAANAGNLGILDTIAEQGNLHGPWDNIIVSDGIKIKNIGTITKEYMNDHKIFYADIAIY